MKRKRTITRREFIKKAGAGSFGIMLAPAIFRCSLSKRKPNILFIMSDDHAYQAIGCYGSVINKTLNIDYLAEGGVRFTNCFCTNSICAPSRAVIMSGKYSHLNGVIDNRSEFNSSQVTLPEILQSAGYETAIIGKWHLKSAPSGFDYWNVLPGQGAYYNPDFIEMGTKRRFHGYVTDVITDIALKWMKNRDSKKPFCLFLHHKAPHRNWMPDLKYLSLYEDEEIPVPDTFYDDYSTRSAAAREQEMSIRKDLDYAFDFKMPSVGANVLKQGEEMMRNSLERMTDDQLKKWNAFYEERAEMFKRAKLEGEELDRWKYQNFIKDYLRCVASVDENVGKVLEFLDENGLSENTIVVYTSDQGFYLGEHGWFDKRFMYEESLRMPLIIRYPGMVEGEKVIDEMVLNLDFAPTLLDLAGVKIPEEMQGESFKPLLLGKVPENWRKSMYYHYYEYPGWHMVKRHYGVRTRRYKLIHFYYDIDAWELYDLEKDPYELNNLYGNSAYADVVEELKSELRRLQKRYGDSHELAMKFINRSRK